LPIPVPTVSDPLPTISNPLPIPLPGLF
jgi:hypothetical protein